VFTYTGFVVSVNTFLTVCEQVFCAGRMCASPKRIFAGLRFQPESKITIAPLLESAYNF